MSTSSSLIKVDDLSGISESLLVIVPLAVLVWAAKNSLSYFKDDSEGYKKYVVNKEKGIYTKAIIPLYKSLEGMLIGDVLPDTDEAEQYSREDVLEFSKKKISMLISQDFSSLQGVVEFQDALEKLLEYQDTHRSINKKRKINRVLLIAIAIISGINFFIGIWMATQTTPQVIFLIWLTLAGIIGLLLFTYYLVKLSLDNQQYNNEE